MGIGGGYHRGLWACECTGGVAENSQEAFAGIAIHRVGLRPMSLLPEDGEGREDQRTEAGSCRSRTTGCR